MLMMLAGVGFLQQRAADAHAAGRFTFASCSGKRLMLTMLGGFGLLLATLSG